MRRESGEGKKKENKREKRNRKLNVTRLFLIKEEAVFTLRLRIRTDRAVIAFLVSISYGKYMFFLLE